MALPVRRRSSCWLQLLSVLLLAAFCVHVLWSSSAEYGRTRRRLLRRLAARSTTAAAAATAGGPPSNASAGRWNWTVSASPQLGAAGPYRVIYDYAPADWRPAGNQSVTYCTHVTAELVERVAPLLDAWDGPVSVAVFVLAADVPSLAGRLAHLRRCRTGFRRRVSVHLVFDQRRAPETARLAPSDAAAIDCGRPPPPPAVSERRRRALPYPVNAARNAARRAARTHFVLSSDVELLPTPNTAALFLELMARVGRGEERRLAAGGRQVYVLPVFEVAARVPQNRSDLVRMLKSGEAVWFHRFVCPHCQKFPGVTQYAAKRYTPGKVTALHITHRQVPFHRWEPIYIGTDVEPLYDERLSWEGKQDKMTQMTEMCLLRYRLAVLDQLFLVHTPQPGGIRRQPGFTDPADAWRARFIDDNQKVYQRIVSQLGRKYPGDNRRCLAR